MAVAYNNQSSATGTSISSLSVNHTIPSTSNRLLVVWVGTRRPAGDAPLSLTYGGVPLSFLGQATQSFVDAFTPFTNLTTFVYYLLAPAVGTQPVTVAFDPSFLARITLGCLSFDGVNQTTPLRANGGSYLWTATTTGATSVTRSSIGVANDGLVADAVNVSPKIGAETQQSPAPSTGNRRYIQNPTHALAGGTKAASASISKTWSWANTAAAVLVAVSIRPVTVGSDTISPTILTLSPVSLDTFFAGTGDPAILVQLPRVFSPILATLREARRTITDFARQGRFVSVEFSNDGDGPSFEVHLVDLDIRLRSPRVWKDW